MPKELERKLIREAMKKRMGKEHTNAYVYGTLRKVEKKKNTGSPFKVFKKG